MSALWIAPTKYLEILKATPCLLQAWIENFSLPTLTQNEGKGTWSIEEILAHLVFNEKTDWLPRVKVILEGNSNAQLEPFNRTGHFTELSPATCSERLREFQVLREYSIKQLESINWSLIELGKKAKHPDFGTINLRQLLAAYVVHDQTHIYQIARCLAYPFRHEVGPWSAYLKIINQNYDT